MENRLPNTVDGQSRRLRCACLGEFDSRSLPAATSEPAAARSSGQEAPALDEALGADALFAAADAFDVDALSASALAAGLASETTNSPATEVGTSRMHAAEDASEAAHEEAPAMDAHDPVPSSFAAPSHEPEPTPAPPSAVRSGEACSLDDAPDFQVSVLLVWSYWQDAYLRSYGRPYFPLPADKSSASSLASACRAAVLLHHTASGASLLDRLSLAEQFLRHVAQAFLRKPGRDGFLQRRGHPLALLLDDLNALGTPWPRKAAVAPAPKTTPAQGPAQTVKALAPQQTAARARDVLALLKQGPCSARPSTRRSESSSAAGKG